MRSRYRLKVTRIGSRVRPQKKHSQNAQKMIYVFWSMVFPQKDTTVKNKSSIQMRRGKNWNRDSTGRPTNRSSSWDAKKRRDPKSDRRDWKKNTDINWIG